VGVTARSTGTTPRAVGATARSTGTTPHAVGATARSTGTTPHASRPFSLSIYPPPFRSLAHPRVDFSLRDAESAIELRVSI
jgi:hypothetical protein